MSLTTARRAKGRVPAGEKVERKMDEELKNQTAMMDKTSGQMGRRRERKRDQPV